MAACDGLTKVSVHGTMIRRMCTRLHKCVAERGGMSRNMLATYPLHSFAITELIRCSNWDRERARWVDHKYIEFEAAKAQVIG